MAIGRKWLRRIFDRDSGALPFVVKTTVFSLAVVGCLLVPIAALEYLVSRPQQSSVPIVSSAMALVFAPVFENLVFIGVIEFMVIFEPRRSTIVITVSLLSAIVHGLVAEWRAIAGFVGFAVMSYSYLLWYDQSFIKRFSITVGQHVLFNLPAVLLTLDTTIEIAR